MASPTAAINPETAKIAQPTSTPALLTTMLSSSKKISDLFFSPGRLPTVEINGRLTPVEAPGVAALTADDTRRIPEELIGDNKHALAVLESLAGSTPMPFVDTSALEVVERLPGWYGRVRKPSGSEVGVS